MRFMEKGTTMVAAIAVCAILILSVLVPIIADNGGTVEKKTTLNNEGTPMIMGDPAKDYTIQWDSALPGMVKVNGNVTTVYFAAGAGATVSPTSKNVTTDLTYGELPTPVRTGYTFDGWYTSTQYTTEITENTVVEGKNDRTLYAKWIGNEYTVTFDAGSGTVSPATKTVTFGQPYGELPVPEYTGHNFAGWFDSNDNPISSATIVSIAEDHTLDAEYTLGQYLVTFTTDGNGTVDVQNVTVDYGTAYTISGNTIVIDGTTVTATGTGSYSFDSWTPATSGTVSGAMTFIANFVLPPVTITFTAQSPGSVDVASYTDVPRNTQYTVADNTVTITGFGTVTASLPDGYYMTGWNVAQGVGTITDAMTFTAQYEAIEIADVVCSNNTTWIVTTDGKLFGCGDNEYGEQGNGLDGSGQKVTTFTQRLENENIRTVSASSISTWVITTDGKLFGCGRGMYGQQGSGNTTNVTTFTQRLENETIANVITYANTTWAVTTDGKLFGCGQNSIGQQGSGNTTNVTTFTQRLENETIANVFIGGDVTWAVTTDGKLFGCGSNSNGQQGDGTTTNVKTFTQRLENETIANVFGSGSTTWAVTTDGKLFGCGHNGSGQQGSGGTASVKSFTQRLTDETIASVSCSSDTTCVVTTDGKLFGCGQNGSGQQGSGGTATVKSFTQRGPAGSVNIPIAIQPLNVPNLNPHLNPFSPAIVPLSVTPQEIVGTDYTFHAGGEDWMLCTVSVGQDQYALALFYAGATSPLLWDEDVTLTFSNGTLSGTNEGTPFSITVTSIFYEGKGDYVLINGNAYVKDDTNILGFAIPVASNGLMVKGTVVSPTAENIGGTITVGDAAVTTASTDYDDVYTVSEVSAAYDTDQTAVCTTVILPNKVIVTETIEDETMKSILSLVPLVMIVGLILAIVGTVLYKKL